MTKNDKIFLILCILGAGTMMDIVAARVLFTAVLFFVALGTAANWYNTRTTYKRVDKLMKIIINSSNDEEK